MEAGAHAYRKLWEDFGTEKKGAYLGYKFAPVHRIGMSNKLREEQMLALAAVGPNDVALDVGCASGMQVFRMAEKGKEAYGVDIAQSFVDAANAEKTRIKSTNTHFAQATAETLPYPDAMFDVLICGEVLEHVFDFDRTINEFLRVLRPHGRLIISVPNLNADGTLWGRFLRLIRLRSFIPVKAFSMEELASHGDAHVREFSGRSMKRDLARFGLMVDRTRTTSFIDGPGFDFLLKIPLRFRLTRPFVLGFERLLTASGMRFGRNLIVRARRTRV